MPDSSEHRHRREVSRLEGFSDAVFAFAITLLVVSLEVPKTFGELMHVMRAFPAFAICFAMLFQVWWRQYRFFRSFDLEDSYVIVVTGVLLFFVLFFVYPLKFMWSLPFAALEGRRITADVIADNQIPILFAIYGAGVIAAFSLLALLYRHAYALRAQLGLTTDEALDARVQMLRNIAIASFGALSTCVALAAGKWAPTQVGLAGPVYCGIGLTEWALARYERRELRRLSRADTSRV